MVSSSGQAANSMLVRSPRAGCRSSRGPSRARSTAPGSGQKITPWGLPAQAGMREKVSPPASTSRGGSTPISPMSAEAPHTRPSRSRSSRVRGPASVSTVRRVLFVSPPSYTYLPRQRRPLPHMAPREPSALYISMVKSPVRPGFTQISPSAPTPKCRSDIRRARPGRSSGTASMQFT